MSRVVHFELAVDDPERAIAFYQNVLGWEIVKWDGPTDYWLVSTGPEGEPGINGGLMIRQPNFPGVVNTVDVSDLGSAVTAVETNGGTVIETRIVIPGIGYLAYVIDTEGNVFGMMQSDPSAAIPNMTHSSEGNGK
ncbi:MAG: VOC family protein [Caldilineales bacterium]|nr:VOC family protein [Caldilineales bacterium]